MNREHMLNIGIGEQPDLQLAPIEIDGRPTAWPENSNVDFGQPMIVFGYRYLEQDYQYLWGCYDLHDMQTAYDQYAHPGVTISWYLASRAECIVATDKNRQNA